LKQVTDILLRPRPEAQRLGAGTASNGPAGQAMTALPGAATYEKEMADLDCVRQALSGMLSEESYLRAKDKIRSKYGKSPLVEKGWDGKPLNRKPED